MAKYQVSVATKITKDGQPFFEDSLAYSNMDYEDVVMMEGLLIGLLAKLNEFGQKKADEKKKRDH